MLKHIRVIQIYPCPFVGKYYPRKSAYCWQYLHIGTTSTNR